MIDTLRSLYEKAGRPVSFMEVCGTHTVAIFKHGIRSLLPQGLRLLSGPGCPVCVTAMKDIDTAVALSRRTDTILCTFGDMMRVPGGRQSLAEAKAEGAAIQIVYSPLDALRLAQEKKDKAVVFFSAGFETTAPSAAATIAEAERLDVPNFYIYSVHKLVPPALEVLLNAQDVRIDGFILPGHVTAIIGTEPYRFIAEKYNTPCVVTGFEASDIVTGISMLLRQIIEGRASVEIQYGKVVKAEGNPRAVEFIDKYFEPADSNWRGIGVLPGSGLALRAEWSHRDAERVFHVEIPESEEPKGCLCGLVLRGVKMPSDCPLFAKTCMPEKPVGACMVSSEGSCAAYYRYRDVLPAQ